MVAWDAVRSRLLWLIVRGVEVALAALVIVSMWWFADAAPGSGGPEGAGGFSGGFLLLLFFGTLFLAISVGIHLLVDGYRVWRDPDTWAAIRTPAVRLAVALLVGFGLAVGMLPTDLSMEPLALGPIVLAWAVLVHMAIGAGLAAWSEFRSDPAG